MRNDDHSDPDLVTIQEFAEQYRVDQSVVRSWIKKGHISYELVGPRKMRRIRISATVKPVIPIKELTGANEPLVGSVQVESGYGTSIGDVEDITGGHDEQERDNPQGPGGIREGTDDDGPDRDEKKRTRRSAKRS